MAHERVVLPPPSIGEDAIVIGEDSAHSESPGLIRPFVSRAGYKLEAALMTFPVNAHGRICADLGANVGGFTDCLLRRGAARVYAVDTAYGVLAWTLRKDPRVVVKDRTNALHIRLPEPVSFVAIDVGWTRQEKVLPAVSKILSSNPHKGAEGGASADIFTLIKPHYESDAARIQKGVLSPVQSQDVLWEVMDRIEALRGEPPHVGRWEVKGIVQSPLEGQKGNIEYIAWLQWLAGAGDH